MAGFTDALRTALAECARNMEDARRRAMPRQVHEDLVTNTAGRVCMLLMDASAAEVEDAARRLAGAKS